MMAKEFKIARVDQDKIALLSHERAATAQKAGYLSEEIEPLGSVNADNIIRENTSLERLSKLRPVFDKSSLGTLTAGNSSPLTDGASAICLAAETVAKEQDREILGFVEDVQFNALDPKDGLLMAPGLAVPALLHRNSLKIADIDTFEIHEAFAAQVLCNMEVWENGWKRYPKIMPIGTIPEDKINRCGGSIALGHPFAATGGRLMLSVVNQLKRDNLSRGVISICAAGAAACAMFISRE